MKIFAISIEKNPLKWRFGGVRRWQLRLKIKHDFNRDSAYSSKEYGTNFQQNMTILSIPFEKNPLKRRIGGVITVTTAFHNLKQ